MSIYKTEIKGRNYLLIFLIISIIVGWIFIKFYKSIVIETGCSNIASNASFILGKNSIDGEEFSYLNVKENCIKDTTASVK